MTQLGVFEGLGAPAEEGEMAAETGMQLGVVGGCGEGLAERFGGPLDPARVGERAGGGGPGASDLRRFRTRFPLDGRQELERLQSSGACSTALASTATASRDRPVSWSTLARHRRTSGLFRPSRIALSSQASAAAGWPVEARAIP
jgi:hypothetical protein